MNGPFVVAQVTGASAAPASATRVIKLMKPQGGTAIVVQASYDGSIKVDFTEIANEKITLVHVGERLIILFDNKSPLTITPFFFSMSVPLSNLTVEVGPGRVVSTSEFAQLFPITNDPSVLPAAGEAGAPPLPASGANFSNPSVDPLVLPNPLPLLGPE